MEVGSRLEAGWPSAADLLAGCLVRLRLPVEPVPAASLPGASAPADWSPPGVEWLAAESPRVSAAWSVRDGSLACPGAAESADWAAESADCVVRDRVVRRLGEAAC